ncbi:hypothetical protein QL285_061819 [Trifolium repens]|nr:hypothetical protein QL285_061819 [Trifolium repens]
MQGELQYIPEIEKFARANRAKVRLTREAERLARLAQENLENSDTSSQQSEESHFEMEGDPQPPLPPRRTLGDYGQWNDGQLANLGFQPANPVNFDIKNSVINALKECSGLENHFHFSYNEVAIDVYLSREGKGKYHENLGLGSGVGYARGRY